MFFVERGVAQAEVRESKEEAEDVSSSGNETTKTFELLQRFCIVPPVPEVWSCQGVIRSP